MDIFNAPEPVMGGAVVAHLEESDLIRLPGRQNWGH